MPRRREAYSAAEAAFRQRLQGEIGRRIAARRRELGLDQETVVLRMELGTSVCISASHFSRIENGKALPNAAHLIGLAAALNTSIPWLLEGNGGGDCGRNVR